MKSLHKIALGLVLVILGDPVSPIGVLPKLLGWILVLAGLAAERRSFPRSAALLGTAGIAAGVAALQGLPYFLALEEPSIDWMLSLPQLAFSFLICTALAEYLPPDAIPTRRFAGLRWVFIFLVAAPVLIFGAGFAAGLVPTAITAVVANVYLIVLLFRSAALAEAQAIKRYGAQNGD